MTAQSAEDRIKQREQDEHREFMERWRGVEVSPRVYRNFCAKCHAFLSVTDERLRHKTDMVCDECYRGSGNTITSTAFSPDRKSST